MRISPPGTMKDFAALKPGDFFLYFVDSSPHWGMLTSNGDNQSPISFTEPAHPNLPTPCVHDIDRFINRTVLVVDAEARIPWPGDFRDSSPASHQGFGALILLEGKALVRVKGTQSNFDIDVATGRVQQARVHPGSITVGEWKIGIIQDQSFVEVLSFPRPTVQRKPLMV